MLGWSIGIKNLDIKESFLKIASPETIYRNVQTSTIITIGRSQRKLLNSNWLEMSCTSWSRRLAVRSRIPLCLIEGKPPLAQEKRMLNCRLCTTGAMKGNPGRIPTKAMASWKPILCKAKTCSFQGRTVSQLEAPLSEATSTEMPNQVNTEAI